MPHYPGVDESSGRVRRAGWSVGEAGGGAGWIVTGTNDEKVTRAEGRIQVETWYRATLRAGACGMLAKPR